MIDCRGSEDQPNCPNSCRDDDTCALHWTLSCDDPQCPAEATCSSADRCVLACPDPSDPESGGCPRVDNCGAGDDGKCNPANNECYASRAAERWDPVSCEWTIEAFEQYERLYHSTAFLLPDGSVASAGGGHARGGLETRWDAQIFEPEYGITGPVPVIEDAPIALPYDGEIMITVGNAEDVNVEVISVTLVRLASVTHGFNMDQRYVPLEWEGGDAGAITVFGPETFDGERSGVAPPGYYMMFARSNTRRVSQARYIRVGDIPSESYVCEPSSTFVAEEVSCASEPIDGVCPEEARRTSAMELPLAQGPDGLVPGWRVVAEVRLVRDVAAPTEADMEEIEALCVQACQLELANRPSIFATCDAPGAFAVPVHVASGEATSKDLIRDRDERGDELLPGMQLDCTLSETCCERFDEDLCRARPRRPTIAEAALGVGEEYRLTLGPSSRVEVSTATSTVTAPLDGVVGYSLCRDPAPGTACPIYVGSFEAQATSTVPVTLDCSDGSTVKVPVGELAVELAQPAFGSRPPRRGRTRRSPRGRWSLMPRSPWAACRGPCRASRSLAAAARRASRSAAAPTAANDLLKSRGVGASLRLRAPRSARTRSPR